MFKNHEKRKQQHQQRLLMVMDEAANAVATLTGIKTMFLENGWSEIGAEQAVIVMLQQSGTLKK